ncbi:MAG: ribulose-phosphate 3-epimerase [Deltaproteobacteria bacterium]|nr:MAG: ribulose-phosphate 3-epimerase [Deltaproteobacteria bacterium]
MPIIAPSILSADFSRLGEDVLAVEKAGADWIHVDVMDGHFVPTITLGPLVTSAVHGVTTLPLDVHLMIETPERYVDDFAKAGASLISVHVEACTHLNSTLAQIRNAGAQAGVVLNPATPLSAIDWVLEFVDLVLIMSVNPGFGGQQFIPNTLSKIRALRRIIDDRELAVLIEVDGGVNLSTIADVALAGADVFVAGSAIFGSEDYQRTIDAFRDKIKDPPQ